METKVFLGYSISHGALQLRLIKKKKKKEFEEHATELSEPSEYELDTFRSVFARLREAAGLEDPRSEASKQATPVEVCRVR